MIFKIVVTAALVVGMIVNVVILVWQAVRK